MYNIDRVRNEFPHIKEGLTYLNHAAIGPFPNCTYEAVEKAAKSRQTIDINNFHGVFNVLKETREMIASMINTSAERIGLTNNTSAGLNIIANGINWKEGDRIIVNDIEFPSNVYPFLNLKRRGVELDFINANNGRITLEQIKEKITNSTKLLAISHVQFLSGFKSDIKQISKLCKEHDVILSVDAIQSIGATSVDVTESGIDFLSSAGHKWLLSPTGTGFIYITKELQEKINLAYVSWMSVKNIFNFLEYKLDLKDTAERFEYAGFNSIGIHGLHATLKFMSSFSLDETSSHILSLTTQLIEGLKRLKLNVITPSEKIERAGIVSFTYQDSEKVVKELEKDKIFVTNREDAVRISPHFYNTASEIDFFLDKLKTAITNS